MEDFILTNEEQDKIENLSDQAELFDMDVDWERLELIPKQINKFKYAEQDNWAGSPEQAWA